MSNVTEIDQKKSKSFNFDELTESTVQKRGEEDKENVNSQVDHSTPIAEVWRSSRNIRPPHRYSSTLDRKSTRLNSSHERRSRMPSSA